MEKRKTVCSVLVANKERIYEAVNDGDYAEVVKIVKSLLDNEPVNAEDAERCIETLSKHINHPQTFLTTLGTWMTAIKVGRRNFSCNYY